MCRTDVFCSSDLGLGAEANIRICRGGCTVSRLSILPKTARVLMLAIVPTIGRVP
jgi:hypothetical protein